MTKNETDRFNSLLKSDDFCDDYAAQIAAISQLPPMASDLKGIITKITDAAVISSSHAPEGATLDKAQTRQKLEDIMMLVCRAASPYYHSAGLEKQFKAVNYFPSDLTHMTASALYVAAEEIYRYADADGANYILYDPNNTVLLKDIKNHFFDVIQDPKREIEFAAVRTENIPQLINEGFALRVNMDLFMQAFIASNPDLYNEWKRSMSIDDTGSTTSVAYAFDSNIQASSIINVDYSSIELQGNTEIKLINTSAGALEIGFGSNATSFVSTETVNANSQKRMTAASLGYNALTSLFLNVRNSNAVPLNFKIEFYLME